MSPEMKKKMQQQLGELLYFVVVVGDLLSMENATALSLSLSLSPSLPPSLLSHPRKLLHTNYQQEISCPARSSLNPRRPPVSRALY